MRGVANWLTYNDDCTVIENCPNFSADRNDIMWPSDMSERLLSCAGPETLNRPPFFFLACGWSAVSEAPRFAGIVEVHLAPVTSSYSFDRAGLRLLFERTFM